jgi:hypothetical protein
MSSPGIRSACCSLLFALLVAGAASADERCNLSQTQFNFSEVPVNFGGSTGWMWVQNDFDVPLEINPTIDSEHFSIGGLHVWLEPGESASLMINFSPQATGYLEAILDMGNELCSNVLLTGTGIGMSCQVEPPFLAFGTVELGQSVSQLVTLTNDGDLAIPIEPGSLSPVLAVLGPSVELQPGDSATVEVVFMPDGPGAYSGVVDWGAWYAACAGVHFSGEGAVNMEPGENRVGVFFDEDYTELIHLNDGSAEFLTGHLVLTDPAPGVGVAGWELLPSLDGSAYITQWSIRGEYVDAGLGDQMIIGLAEPLPFAEDILLATCQIYVAESVGETIAVQLDPVWNPTISGRMAWLPADGSGEPQVMLPFTGVQAVAWIKTAALSPGPDPLPAVGTVLGPNVPNPFNPSTEIRFSLADDGPASVRIFDLTGRLVRTLVDETLLEGSYARLWDGRDQSGRQAASGAYYVRLEAAGELATRKIMLLK